MRARAFAHRIMRARAFDSPIIHAFSSLLSTAAAVAVRIRARGAGHRTAQPEMSLSARQVAQFEEAGWLDLGCVLSQAELETHRAAYDSCLATLAEKHAGEDHLPDISRPPRPGLRVHQIRAAHLQHNVFAKLIRRPMITDAVASLVADDLKIILCQGLYKPPRIGGELNWHQVEHCLLGTVRGLIYDMTCTDHQRARLTRTTRTLRL